MRIPNKLPPVLAVLSLVLPSTVAQAEDDGDEDHDEGEDSTYGRKGTFEAGGDVSMSWNEDVFVLDRGPSLGYFVADRFEITLSLDFIYTRTEDDDTDTTVTTKAGSS